MNEEKAIAKEIRQKVSELNEIIKKARQQNLYVTTIATKLKVEIYPLDVVIIDRA